MALAHETGPPAARRPLAGAAAVLDPGIAVLFPARPVGRPRVPPGARGGLRRRGAAPDGRGPGAVRAPAAAVRVPDLAQPGARPGGGLPGAAAASDDLAAGVAPSLPPGRAPPGGAGPGAGDAAGRALAAHGGHPAPQDWGSAETPLPDPATLRFALTDLGATDGNDTGATGSTTGGRWSAARRTATAPCSVRPSSGTRDGRATSARCPATPTAGPTASTTPGRSSRPPTAPSTTTAPSSGRAATRRNLPGLDGYPHSKALSLNNQGQVAGYAQTGAHDARRELVARAALWTGGGGTPTDLGTLGGDYSAAYGLNDRGQVVGKADTAYFGSTHAFLWQNGRMTDLGTLGGPNSLALRVNNRGMVVGYSETGTHDPCVRLAERRAARPGHPARRGGERGPRPQRPGPDRRRVR